MKKYRIQLNKVLAILFSVTLICASSSMLVYAAEPIDSDNLQYDYVTELPDGGKIYTYIIDGIENNFPVPPDGFDPITASDEALETYGFPPRPENLQDLADWTETMSYYEYTPVPEIEQTEQVHGVFQPAVDYTKGTNLTNTAMTSANWSGYVAKGGTNAFAQVQGDFVQPTIQSGCSSNTYESTWVGLGGYNSQKLVQTGTAMNTVNGGRNYYAWYEYLGPGNSNPEIRFNSITVRAGDRIHCYCSFQRSNGVFNAYIANNTNGTSQSVVLNIPTSTYYDGTSAEFINERPMLSNGTSSWYASLTKYGTTNWTNCQVYLSASNKWVSLGSQSTDSITMKNNGRALATPSGLSGQTFKSTWNNYS